MNCPIPFLPCRIEERINIVEECINTGCNYASTANKYGCSYGQVYAWVRKYKDKEELMLAIEKYIDYYKNKRVQRNLGVLTPLEFHEQKLENVA
ncbi:hypothetical protein DW928_15625 [Firmicutes bacterium AM43-11BH]|nr:hypothetical protein DW928_15625 [Firmicutes bacterium AM43-11BH]